MNKSAVIAELCDVEADDALHEFGGGHGNKGNDFARFWLINEMLALTGAGEKDFLFLLEYAQDVAMLDSASEPTAITLYQLKKRENSAWDLNTLAGLTQKTRLVKPESPLAKLLRSMLGFKSMSTNAEFISNARFKVALAAGGTAIQMDYLDLSELTIERQADFRNSTAMTLDVDAAQVPLHRVGLRYAPIEVNDMRAHVIGVAHGVLKHLSAAHAAQADAFVDALFAKLATASRNTSKCKTWPELVKKRGYSREQFGEALAALQLLPDQQRRREELLEEVASTLRWRTRDEMRVEVALTELARLKLVGSTVLLTDVDWLVIQGIIDKSDLESWETVQEFAAVESAIRASLPDESTARVRALAIYSMVQAWTNQTFVSSSGH
ncbi:DUF4297 domain-containing protein [Cupriavidus plantarum]|uniref:DUF4297 domain-containing protein n=1 Tax=Cupriavidus plantarum TaxID=942865 RepID=UPI000E2857BD|nr:DUF4297 domain-containing protein [Cupriavidus plantarum]NYI00122.1 hypothetical protein [Cupriavidus plantarum]REF01949.1 uncharacterized protein DUF4297 [Cupriavidus plantarum]